MDTRTRIPYLRLPKRYRTGRLIATAAAFIAVAFACLVFFSTAPSVFPEREIVTVKPGSYMSQAADLLHSDGVVRSPFLFKLYVMLLSGHRQVQAGDYLFDSPQSAIRVAYRLVNGEQDLPKIKVTFTEGLTSKDMGDILKKNIPGFDTQTFLAEAKPHEGMLFPDTYFLYPTAKPADVIDLLHSTFREKTKPLLLQIQAFGKPLSDILAMASIVEREATSSTDRRIIAGILWRRIASKMPLQVDPPFYYILGKDSAHLTLSDLAMDSPYNLYRHTGLPPTPIDNPGLDAIEAVLDPTPTPYFFYLSGRDGIMHYAATLAGHIANRQKYL